MILNGGKEENAPENVERFVFRDGDELTLADVRLRVWQQKGNWGQDVLDARKEAAGTVLEPGPGFDHVIMDDDSPVILHAGDGIDIIELPDHVNDAVIQLPDYAPQQAKVRFVGDDGRDVALAFPERGDLFILKGGLSGAALPPIEFGDGTRWTRQDLAARLIADQKGNDDDFILGAASDDTLEGGLGDDELHGGAGDDVYVFRRGDGHDVIEDTAGEDTLEIHGYSPEDMHIRRPDPGRDDFLITFTGTSDQILLRYTDDGEGVNRILFADGTQYDKAWIFGQATLHGTDFDDVLTGTGAGETLNGGRGDDDIDPGDGDDIVVHERGSGLDTIRGSRGYDGISLPDHGQFDISYVHLPYPYWRADGLLILGPDEAILVDDEDVEWIQFANGVRWGRQELDAIRNTHLKDMLPRTIDGGVRNETVEGTPRSELFTLDYGSDTIIFNRGGGRDIVDEILQKTTTDVIVLRGYKKEDAVYDLDETEKAIVVRFKDSDDEILIKRAFDFVEDTVTDDSGREVTVRRYVLDHFVFDDGEVAFGDIVEPLRERLTPTFTEGHDYFRGHADAVDPGEGFDVLLVQGHMEIDYNPGDGRDLAIADSLSTFMDFRVHGYTPDETEIWDRGGRDFYISFARRGDFIEVHPNWFGTVQITFDDGTVWDYDKIKEKKDNQFGIIGDGDDEFIRVDKDDLKISSAAGDDTINLDYVDTDFHWKVGDGWDYASGGGNINLFLDDIKKEDAYIRENPFYWKEWGNSDLLIGRSGAPEEGVWIEDGLDLLGSITFSGGASFSDDSEIISLISPLPSFGDFVLVNYFADQEFEAKSGNQYYYQGATWKGKTTYHFSEDSGHDEILEQYHGSREDTVIIDDNNFDDFHVYIDTTPYGYNPPAGDLVLVSKETGKSLRIRNAKPSVDDGGQVTTIETIRFADGTEKSVIDLYREVEAREQQEPRNITGSFAYDPDTHSGDYFVHLANGYGATPISIDLSQADTAGVQTEMVHGRVLLTIPNTAGGQGYDARFWLSNIEATSLLLADGSTIPGALLRAAAQLDLPLEAIKNGAFADNLELGKDVTGRVHGLMSVMHFVPVGSLDEFEPGKKYYTKETDADGTEVFYSVWEDEPEPGVNYYVGTKKSDLTLHGLSEGDIHFEWKDTSPYLSYVNAQGERVWVDLSVALQGDELTIHFDDGQILDRQQVAQRLPVIAGSGQDDAIGFGLFPWERVETLPVSIEGGRGDDIIGSLSSQTTWIYSQGDGHDLVDVNYRDIDGRLSADNSLTLHDVSPQSVRLVRQGTDLLLRIAESKEGVEDEGSIRFVNAFPEYTDSFGIGQIRFDDGTIWNREQILDSIVELVPPPPSGPLNHMRDGDPVILTSYDDYVTGSIGEDVYVYKNGGGDDIIEEDGRWGQDVLQFADLTLDDIRFIRSNDDLILEVIPDAERGIQRGSVTIRDGIGRHLAGDPLIETYTFADGTSLNFEDVPTRVLQHLMETGTDRLEGSIWSETFPNAPGRQVMNGREGSDTFVWSRGDGDDVIADSGESADEIDALKLTDVLPQDIELQPGVRGLFIKVAESQAGAGDGALITLPGTLLRQGDEGLGIDRLEFADGTVWDRKELASRVLEAVATDGDDWLRGSGAGETIAGGRGNDLLEGGKGDDVYVYARGDGFDVIKDDGGTDILELTGIAPDDVRLSKAGDNGLWVSIATSGERAGDAGTIFIHHGLNDAVIDEIHFDDGTVWKHADFDALLARQNASEFADHLTGTHGDDTLTGLRGDDLLEGGEGDDTYVYRAGDGNDTIRDTGGDDVLILEGIGKEDVRFERRSINDQNLLIDLPGGAQITVVNGLREESGHVIEQIRLADGSATWSFDDVWTRILAAEATTGDDLIPGTERDDVLQGGKGDDILRGGGGSDVYLYHKGDGDDRIEDDGNDDADVLKLLDYTPADVLFLLRAGPGSEDAVLRLGDADSHDRIILADALSQWQAGVDKIEFADGTVWDKAAMRVRALADVDGPGNDAVYGFATDDILIAEPGDDLMVGGYGEDVYRIGPGDGHDVLRDDGWRDEIDTLELEHVVSSEVQVQRLYRGSDSVVLTFVTEDDQSVTLVDFLNEDAARVDRIQFADGVVWERDKVLEVLENHAPVANEDGYYRVLSGETITLSAEELLANDFDTDNDDLRIIAVDGGAHGTAQLDADGNVVFSANDDFYGATTFTYVVSDGRNGIGEGMVNVRIRPQAEAHDDEGFVVNEDETLVIRSERLLANDLDGDRMIVGRVYDAHGGRVSLSSDGNITFVPDADYNGPASFTYVANTPEGGVAEAQVHITVEPVNDAPIAREDSGFETDEGQALIIAASDLLANDIDVDGDALSITGVSATGDLEVSLLADGNVLVTPGPYVFGMVNFGYTIADAAGVESSALVHVNVRPVDDPPEAHDDYIDTTVAGERLEEDNPRVIAFSELLANDLEHDGESLSLTDISNVRSGRARILNNETILFEPEANFHGEAGFDYTVADEHGNEAVAHVTLDYAPVNDNPIARDDSHDDPTRPLPFLRGFEDTPLTFTAAELLANDFDVEGETVTLVSVGSAAHGSVTLTDDGQITFTPEKDYHGEASFQYLIADPQGAVADATVTLFFEAVEDVPPVAEGDDVTLYEDSSVIIPRSFLLTNDHDRDNDPISWVSWRYPSKLEEKIYGKLNGRIEELSNGDLRYTPDPDAFKAGVFFYTITDNDDGEDEGMVDIHIIPVPDAPTAVDDDGGETPPGVPLVIEVNSVLRNDFDVDQPGKRGDEILTLTELLPVSRGQARLETYAGNTFIVARFDDGVEGPVLLRYRVQDETGLQNVGAIQARVGGEYDHQRIGTARGDWLEGMDGNELLDGKESDDMLIGHGGDDRLFGGEGNDTLKGGAGDDRLEAGAGDDVIEAGDGDDTIIAGAGRDMIDGGEGYDIVDFSASNTGVRVDLQSRLGQGGIAAGDVYRNIEHVIGTGHADRLHGGDQPDVLEGGDGDDLLSGRGGDDTLRGGGGDDVIDGGAGADVIDGGDGDDTVSYLTSAEGVEVSLRSGVAKGGDAEGDILGNIENIEGSDAADRLEGDDANNILTGHRGDDVLIGGAGDDILQGGRGADRLIGGDGMDIADYTLSPEGVAINMADPAASGGEASGDVFESIEIVQGSYHDDVIIGDNADNIIRGGRGADVIDGGAGFDTADYSRSDDAVEVDLGLGRGLAGEAAGDTLRNIEKLIGSVHDDVLRGSAESETFEGGRGDDVLAGAAGGDTYLFGYDSGHDRIVEEAGAGTDRIIFDADVMPKDVSVIRQGTDMLLELERQGGILVERLLVEGQFDDQAAAGRGIEEVVFADGTVWQKDDLIWLAGDEQFNARDDIIRVAWEETPLVIDPRDLFRNDTTGDPGRLALVSVSNARHATVEIGADGRIHFLGEKDYFGDAFFDYTVRDLKGRESTATVEVNLANVNDPPVAVDDGVIEGYEDEPLLIPVEQLLANDYDVDGDDLQIVALGFGPLRDELGNTLPGATLKGTHGKAKLTGAYVSFAPEKDHYGPAGFTYTIVDAEGETDTAQVELYLRAVNDAPRGSDAEYSMRLGQTLEIPVSDLVSHARDPEGDPISFERVLIENHRLVHYDADRQVVRITPEAEGPITFSYDVADDKGATGRIKVKVNVRPPNDPPHARDDDGFSTPEDEPLIIDPAALLSNDSDPDGDKLTLAGVDRFGEHGKAELTPDGMIRFVPDRDYNGDAGFTYFISDGHGNGDHAFVSVDVILRNDPPVVRDDVPSIPGYEDHALTLVPAEIFGNDNDPEGDVIFLEDFEVVGPLEKTYLDHGPVDLRYAYAPEALPDGARVRATLKDGAPLPDWLRFDDERARLTGTPPADASETFEVALQYAFGDATLQRTFTIDPKDGDVLIDGLDWGNDFVVFSIAGRVAQAEARGHQPLPSWLTFDPNARQFRLDGAPAPDDEPVPVQVRFIRQEDAGTEDVLSTVSDAPGIEFVIDPSGALTEQIEKLNALLKGVPFFEEQGLFAVDVKDADLSVAQEAGTSLPRWLAFDEESLAFSGEPPDLYVGEIDTRLRVDAAGDAAFDLLLPVVVDENFGIQRDVTGDVISSLSSEDDAHLTITPVHDFWGAVALRYRARDEKDAVSDAAALIVVNFIPLPDAEKDALSTNEDEPLVFSPADLLANDHDEHGDPLRVLSVSQPQHGRIEILAGTVDLPPPDDLPELAQGRYSATLADGSPLPDWLEVDAESGHITGTIPFDVRETLEIHLTVENGQEKAEATFSHAFDGNAGAALRYVPDPHWHGKDSFSYTITDDAQGRDTGQVEVTVAPRHEPPRANEDVVHGIEDTPLVIDPARLLANDTDVDGDPLRLIAVENAGHGSVRLENGEIIFEPEHNFDGDASFEYVVTDDTDGEARGHVIVKVQSTNRAPIVADEHITGREDEPLTLRIADLLANDSDPDGDAISFVSISSESLEGNAKSYRLPDGRLQFVPEPDANGDARFEYQVGDGRLTAKGTLVIDFIAENDPPFAVGDEGFVTEEDVPLHIATSTLLANDWDVEGDDFSLVEVFGGIHGRVDLNGDAILFTPEADYAGNAGFSYLLRDANGAESIGRVSIQVLSVNDPPQPVGDSGLAVDEDDALLIDPARLLANDTDPDGDTLTLVSLEVVSGDAEIHPLEDGRYRVEPAADYAGPLVLRYMVSDGHNPPVGADARITVRPVPDAPVAGDDVLHTREDEPVRTLVSTLLANDSDPDHMAVLFDGIVGTQGVSVTVDDAGHVTITPDPDVYGEGGFDYRITDTTGRTDIGHVRVDIAPVNDAPEIGDIGALHGVEDEPFVHRFDPSLFTDVDGDAVSVDVLTANGAPLPDWLHWDAGQLTLRGTPPADFFGDYPLQVVAGDGKAQTVADVTLEIAPVNDLPRLAAPFSDRFSPEDEPINIALQKGLVYDPDGDPLSFSLTMADGAPLPGWLHFDANELRLSGQPPQDATTDLALRLTVDDGTAAIHDDFHLIITPVNDPPVANDDTGFVVPAGESLLIDSAQLIANDNDVDGDVLTLSDVGQARHGQVSLTPDGNVRYVANADFAGEDTFIYEIDDGQARAEARVHVTVSPRPETTVTDPAPGTQQGAEPTVSSQPEAAVIDPVLPGAEDQAKRLSDKETYSSAGEENADVASDALLHEDTFDFSRLVSPPDPIAPFQPAGYGAGRLNLSVNGSGSGDRLIGTTGHDVLKGYDGNDTLFGGAGNDRLEGGKGADRLEGGKGDDVLIGGEGKDVFVYRSGGGTDVIEDFGRVGKDGGPIYVDGDVILIDVEGIENFEDLLAHARQEGDDVVIDFGNGDVLILRDTQLAALDGDAFTFY